MTLALLTTLLLAGPSLDVRVEGDGYLRLGRGPRTVYATRASLARVNGALGTASGDLLLPRLPIPASGDLQIDLEGNVTAGKTSVGRLVLARFPQGTRLTPTEGAFTTITRPTLVNPGEGDAGVIRSGATRANAGPSNEAATGVTINIPARSEVEGEQFTIGDIAKIDGDPALVTAVAAVNMGYAPVVGSDRGLLSVHVISRIRLAGIDAKKVTLNMPPTATVVRRAQIVTPTQMVEAAQQAVQSKLGINIKLVATKDPMSLPAPPGQVELSADAGTFVPAGIPVTITARIGSRIVGTRMLTMIPADGTGGVRTGETVQVRMICNGAAIELTGRVTTNGWVGQTVTVQASTGDATHPTLLNGIVTAPGVVEVKA